MVAIAVSSDLLWAWWATLGAGLAVALVVTVLLHVLLRLVRDIEWGLEDVWGMGKEVARNTATTWLLDEAALRARMLEEEIAAQHRLLQRGG